MKHKTFAKAGMAALALSFFMMIALTGCPMDGETGSPGNPVTLTGGEWTSGRISEPDKDGNRDINWYTFTAASADKIYRIQWADAGQYGAYTPVPMCDIFVTAYQSDKSTVLFSSTDQGFSPARAIPRYAGTVYLKVAGAYSFSNSTGTYAIKYYEEGDAIVSLSANTWVNARLDESSEEDMYTFTAQAGTTYGIQWADSDQYGAYIPVPTCDIRVTAYQSDRATVLFSLTDSGFTTPKTITSYTGIVYLKVVGYNTGTYAIRYTSP
ncbi:MAG: hypothetical protein LBC88_05230 [Spirochaetaceae bacterium]|jgi:hypothetical protein|nr:hypothetical protein [Spirochaetaceae bacterium]